MKWMGGVVLGDLYQWMMRRMGRCLRASWMDGWMAVLLI